MNYKESLIIKKLMQLPGYLTLLQMLKFLIRLGASDENWSRIVMYRETQKIINSLNCSDLNVLEISGDRWGKLNSFKKYKHVDYPEFNICESSLEETFDLIIAEQVFEHLLWPYRAGKNIYNMLDPNGFFLITTPFLLRVHNVPTDCSRWTETGLKHFLAECGFNLRNIQTGSWGNRACIKKSFSQWAKYHPLIHSLRNEPDFPIVVWAFAKK